MNLIRRSGLHSPQNATVSSSALVSLIFPVVEGRWRFCLRTCKNSFCFLNLPYCIAVDQPRASTSLQNIFMVIRDSVLFVTLKTTVAVNSATNYRNKHCPKSTDESHCPNWIDHWIQPRSKVRNSTFTSVLSWKIHSKKRIDRNTSHQLHVSGTAPYLTHNSGGGTITIPIGVRI